MMKYLMVLSKPLCLTMLENLTNENIGGWKGKDGWPWKGREGCVGLGGGISDG